MITYKKIKNFNELSVVSILRESDQVYIPLDPDNTDYANFKEQILTNKAELQDVDGNVMSEQAAQEFVRGLP